MLKVQKSPIKQMNCSEEDFDDSSMLQLLIGLLKHPQIAKETVNLHFLLKTINHSTQNYYNYTVNEFINKQK